MFERKIKKGREVELLIRMETVYILRAYWEGSFTEAIVVELTNKKGAIRE